MEEIYKITPKEEEDKIVAENPEVPIIYGDFTNWEPKPLFEICDLSEKFYPQYNDDHVFDLMKQAGKMGYGQSNSIEGLNKNQKIFFKEYVTKFYEEKIDLNWKEVFERKI